MKSLFRWAVAVAALALLAACGTPSGPQVAATSADSRSAKVQFRISGAITHVSDGDTVTISGPSGPEVIRMSDMDTPEVSHGPSRPGQRFGRAAEASLKTLAPLGASAKAECYERDQYDRSVCTVFVGTTNLNLEQTRLGNASRQSSVDPGSPKRIRSDECPAAAPWRVAGAKSAVPGQLAAGVLAAAEMPQRGALEPPTDKPIPEISR